MVENQPDFQVLDSGHGKMNGSRFLIMKIKQLEIHNKKRDPTLWYPAYIRDGTTLPVAPKEAIVHVGTAPAPMR